MLKGRDDATVRRATLSTKTSKAKAKAESETEAPSESVNSIVSSEIPFVESGAVDS